MPSACDVRISTLILLEIYCDRCGRRDGEMEENIQKSALIHVKSRTAPTMEYTENDDNQELK